MRKLLSFIFFACLTLSLRVDAQTTNAVGIINSNDSSIGLIGDARQCSDASVNGTTVTSATGCQFTNADIGKIINLNGAAASVPISNNPSVFIVNGSTALTGINVPGGATNTYFLDQLAPGMQITIGAQTAIIASIQSQTAATLAAAWPAATCNPCSGMSITGVWKAVISSVTNATTATIIPPAPIATTATKIGAWIYTDNTAAWYRLNTFLINNDSSVVNFVKGPTGIFRKNDDAWGMQNLLRADLRFNGANLVGGFGYGTQNSYNAVPRPPTGFVVTLTNGSSVVTTGQAPGTGFLAGGHVLPGDILTFSDSPFVGVVRTVICVSSDNTLVVNAPLAASGTTHYSQTALGYTTSGAVQEGQFTTSGTPNGILQSSYNYINTVEAGQTTIQLSNPAFVVNGQQEYQRYAPGDPIFIGGYDQQGFGIPPNFRYFEYNTVVSVSSGGLITLLTPTRYKYDSGWNWMPTDLTGQTFPMGALVMPLNKPSNGTTLGRVENLKLVARDLVVGSAEPGTAPPGGSRSTIQMVGSLQVELYDVQTISAAFGDIKNISIYDSYFGNWDIDQIGGIEVDKAIESFNIDSTSKASRGRYQSIGQGTGALLISLKNSIFDSINVTPRSLEVIGNDLLGSVAIGGGWAINNVKVENNRYFTDLGRRTLYPVTLTNSSTNVTAPAGTFKQTDIGRLMIGLNLPSATVIKSVTTDGSGCTINQNATATSIETITVLGQPRLLANANSLFQVTVVGSGAAGTPPAPTNQSINVNEALQGASQAPPNFSHLTLQPGTVLTKQPLTGTGTIAAISNTLAVTNATNTAPIVVTTGSFLHGLNTGDTVTISGVVTNTAANGTFVITRISGSTFSLNGTTGNGVYGGGGTVIPALVTVTGTSTTFGTDILAGNAFIFNGQSAKVATIIDATHLILSTQIPISPLVSGQPFQYDTAAGYLNRGTVTNLNKALTTSTKRVTSISYVGGVTSVITLNSADPNLVSGQELQISDGTNTFVTAIRDVNPVSGLTTLHCFPIVYLSASPLNTGAVSYTFKYATTQILANFKVAPSVGDIFTYNSIAKAYLAHNSFIVDGVEQPLSMLSSAVGNSGPTEAPTAEYFYSQDDNNGFEQSVVIYNLPKVADNNQLVPIDIKGYISSIDVIITKGYTGVAGPFTLRLTDNQNGYQDANFSYTLINCNLPGVRSVTPWTANGAQSGDVLTPQQYRYVDTLFLIGGGDSNPTPDQQYQGFVVVRYVKRVW